MSEGETVGFPPEFPRLSHSLPTLSFVERQVRTSKLPSPLVFLPILTHFTTTPVVPLASSALESSRVLRSPVVEPLDLTKHVLNRR